MDIRWLTWFPGPYLRLRHLGMSRTPNRRERFLRLGTLTPTDRLGGVENPKRRGFGQDAQLLPTILRNDESQSVHGVRQSSEAEFGVHP
jgi:hypothetical protein